MNRMTRYEKVTGDTVVTSFRSNNEFAKYHYFNSNGAYAKHRAMIQTAFQLVEDDLINSGWLISLDADYHYKNLSRLAMMERNKLWDVRYHVDGFKEETEYGYNKMARVMLGELDRAGREV